jgi:pilus assembly protein Flp/PilA
MRARITRIKKLGQGLVEYSIIIMLIAIVVILAVTFLGQYVNSSFSKISSGFGG